MQENLVIFGAGASFGSGEAYFGTSNNYINRLPALGNSLFDELQDFNPDGWGKLDDRIKSVFNDDFEKGMSQLADNNPHKMPPLQRAMAAYFFNFYPGKSNLYMKFAEKIKHVSWNGAMATLNYERLLEHSLLRSGVTPVLGYGFPYQPGSVEICYPHGCCHLFCDSVQGSSGAVSFSGTGVTTDGPVSHTDDQNRFLHRIVADAFPPVMCYFNSMKTVTSGKTFISKQKQRLQALINNAKNIAIIGVRVRPNDIHIWDSLAKTTAKLIYCSGLDGGKEFDEWRLNIRTRKNDVTINSYFQESFDTICSYVNL